MLLRRKVSLSQKTFALFIGLFTLIICISMGLSYYNSSQSLKDELSYSNNILINQVEQNIDTILNRIDNNIVNFMMYKEFDIFTKGKLSDPDEERSNLYELSRKLHNFKNSNDSVYSVAVYSKDRKEFFDENGLYEENDFYDNTCIKDLAGANGKQFFITTRKIESTPDKKSESRDVITLVRAYPLASKIGMGNTGLIIINIDESVLDSLIRNAKPHRLAQILIINEEGRVISNDNKNDLYKDISNEKFIKEIAATNGQGLIEAEIGGAKQSLFYIYSPYTKWYYICIVPTSQLNAPLTSMKDTMLVIGFMMLLISIISVILINKWTFKPIDGFIKQVADKIKSTEGNETINNVFGSPHDLERIFGGMIDQNEKMRAQIGASVPAMKWRLTTEILSGRIKDYKEALGYLELLGISLHSSNYMVILIDIDNKSKLLKTMPEEGMRLYTSTLAQKTEEFLNVECKSITAELIDGKISAIVSFGEESYSQIKMNVISASDMIRNFIEKYFNISLSIAVGHLYKNFDDIHKSFNEAEEALKYRAVIGNGSTIFYSELCSFDNRELNSIYKMTSEITNGIKNNNIDAIKEGLSKVFKEMINKSLPPEIVCQISIFIVMQSAKVITDLGMDDELIFKDQTQSLYEGIYENESINEIHNFLQNLFEDLYARLSERKNNNSNNNLINHVISYIEKNYTSCTLSLNEVADKFNLSMPYLSKIFKEVTQKNFVDYLIQVRMEEAKKLLSDGNNKINEIGIKVGYENYYSFTRMFKKYTGTTPGDYRKQINIDKN